ncbi:MAG: murein hydrolase activator EnvC family protein [Polyangiaceae bacterium]
MRRAWVVATAVAAASPFVASSHAAPLAGARPSSDPALALAALDRKIADLDSEEQSDKQELGRLAGEIASARARVITRGRAFYKLTRAGLLPLGGGFDALVTHAMHVERARRLLVANVDEDARLHGRAGDLAHELERVARDRVALASQRTAMDAARLAMDDEVRRQAAFDKAFETSTATGSDYVAVNGGTAVAAPEVLPGAFSAARGRLLFPVVARSEAHPAHREGTDGPGLEIHAAVGSVVRAVFAGRVAFADRYGPYGRIVILDHGDHYYTVSGDLDEIDVKIGQEIGAGERLGTVGDDGQGAMLYFEVRHGSQTVQPGAWLGL